MWGVCYFSTAEEAPHMASGGARRGGTTSERLLTLFQRWVALHNSPPEFLYHYSTAQGMLSMLQSGHVWATESRYMNDSREFVHGSDLILSVIKRHHRKKSTKTLQQLRTAVMEHVNEKRQNLRIFARSRSGSSTRGSEPCIRE